MASGVQIPDECVNSYRTDLKMGKKHRYLIYKLSSDMKEIIIDERGERGISYDDFKEKLLLAEQCGECRYAVFDLEYVNDKNANVTKLIFISWAPDSAKVKNKMVHASSKDAFKKALGDGLAKEFQASDLTDLDVADIIKDLNKLSRA